MERVLGDVLLPASILDFRAKLGNHCMFYRRNAPGDAVILDFRLRLGNHCRVFTRNALQRAVILDLMGSIWESLQGFAYRISSLNDVRVRF